MFATAGQIFADPLQGANKQRIGNYDIQMITEPKNPGVGSPTDILIRIGGVNGDDLVDVPIVMRLVKDGVEVQRTSPLIVPYGHYTQQFSFAQAGRYVLYVDLNDYSYSGETLTFTFFINVAGKFDYLYIVGPTAAVIVVGIVSTLVFLRMRRKKKKSTREAQS